MNALASCPPYSQRHTVRTEDSIVTFGTAYRRERAVCPFCGRIVAVKMDGTFFTHKTNPDSRHR
jgi:hypothetical protein